ncbi:MAG: UvrD-helicase domain-containing protein, partial [Desulfobacterales bacterium]|nr:UvrD-helicase domain-containing protein [Desulfobacterales bacterium]
MSYTSIKNCEQIDLDRHALIEASAGTGKTYTIENLVVRFLKEKAEISIENILLVTFTEKGACELKIRIREKLEQELDAGLDDASAAEKIQDNLDAFDEACIYTIHGFCHAVLKDYAFENGTLFQNELISDGPLFETMLKERMRTEWPRLHGEHLPELLALSGFHAGKDRFLANIISVARNTHRPEVGDILRPAPGEDDYPLLRARLVSGMMALKKAALSPAPLSEGYGRLNIHSRTRGSLIKNIIEPLEEFLERQDEAAFDMAGFSELMTRVGAAGQFKKRGASCLLPEKYLKKGPNPEVCPNLEKVVEILEKVIGRHAELKHFLAFQTITRLREDVARAKRENGWISYDDMLTRVDAALQGKGAAALQKMLQTKHRVVFVDEFQDTDPVQWRIFKKVFLESRAESRLFLIGDPKQAIYSFRGADVFAYLDAKNAIERLKKRGKANLYTLDTNWRSTPELIRGFNRLFRREEWFPPHEKAGAFEIGYQPVNSPGEAEQPARIIRDASGRDALNIVALDQFKSTREAKQALAKFIASEIFHLTSGGGVEILKKGEEPSRLDLGDICILVRAKSEAPVLEAELRKRGVPYSFYKKPGLFLSEEAFHLGLLFRAILNPGFAPDAKSALLTPFFGLEAADPRVYEDLPMTHAVRRLFFQWSELARKRWWSRLFQSIMEDAGWAFRESATGDWDRKSTNLRQICEFLETSAYRKNLDFRGLAALLDGLRKQTVSAEDEADIHQIETDDRKVQIMTMHVSKGLQFPVVFIAGGLTRASGAPFHVFHEFNKEDPSAGVRKVIDLSKQEGKARDEKEKIDEDKRLLYVALTRARFKLYIPYYPAKGFHPWAGPVSRFMASAMAGAFPEDAENPAAARPPLEPRPPLEAPPPGRPMEGDAPQLEPTPLFPLSKTHAHKKILLESFSSLQAGRRAEETPDAGAPDFSAGVRTGREDDEGLLTPPADEIPTQNPADEIPGGADP